MDFHDDSTAEMGALRRSPARLLLLGAAAVPAAGLLAPVVLRLAAWGGPRAYTSALTWLTPPYLYVIVNGIILTIAAASLFQKGAGGEGSDGGPAEDVATAASMLLPPKHEEEMVAINYDKQPEDVKVVEIAKETETEDEGSVEVCNEEKVEGRKGKEEGEGEGEGEVTAAKISTCRSGEIPTDFSGTPTISRPFGGRKTARASPTGSPLKVSQHRRGETLESTWKMITQGCSVPLARHLEQSDASEIRNAKARDQSSSPASKAPKVRQVPLRRAPSPGLEELNKRVEGFIQRFKEEMRLQREKSLQRYWGMIQRRR